MKAALRSRETLRNRSVANGDRSSPKQPRATFSTIWTGASPPESQRPRRRRVLLARLESWRGGEQQRRARDGHRRRGHGDDEPAACRLGDLRSIRALPRREPPHGPHRVDRLPAPARGPPPPPPPPERGPPAPPPSARSPASGD